MVKGAFYRPRNLLLFFPHAALVTPARGGGGLTPAGGRDGLKDGGGAIPPTLLGGLICLGGAARGSPDCEGIGLSGLGVVGNGGGTRGAVPIPPTWGLGVVGNGGGTRGAVPIPPTWGLGVAGNGRGTRRGAPSPAA